MTTFDGFADPSGLADLSAAMSPDVFLSVLRKAEWSGFTPARHLPALRARLVELERAYGVTEAHRFATEQITAAGAVLRHPDGHPAEIDAVALSPCGRYLAVGSFCGDDYYGGGLLQVWELITARCVNAIPGVMGGVGWPYYLRTIQWSADGRRIALAYNTNQVGLWDPFGEGEEPLTGSSISSADGASRPAAFALSPDASRVFVGASPEYIDASPAFTVHGHNAALVEGAAEDDWDDEEADPQEQELGGPLPAEVQDRLDDGRLFFDQVFWSRDGNRLYGYGRPGWTCTIDVASRQVTWLGPAGWRADAPQWSLDERLVAQQLDDRLLIADAATGEQVAELPAQPGAELLCWGAAGDTARLAVVVPDRNDDRARPKVAIYEDGWHRYDLDTTVKNVHHDKSDARVWAWAPDGHRAACLTPDDRIEIWSLGVSVDRPARLLDAPADTVGLLWGADDVLVAVGEKTLRFVRPTTGRVLGDFTFLREAAGSRPLDTGSEDLGADLSFMFGGDPTFALDEDTWAAAFGSGLVIATEERRADLDALLAWTVDRRFAWPTAWGKLDLVADAAGAADRLGPPLADFRDQFRGGSASPRAASDWPPPDTATVDDLYDAARRSVGGLGEEWDYHVSKFLRHAARLRARNGDVAEARDLLGQIPTDAHRVRGTADVAMILAAAGQAGPARDMLASVEPEIESVIDRYNTAFVASAVGGAYAALGDDARADTWFARARAGIEPETNPGEHYLAVAWAMIECGRTADGRALLLSTPGVPSSFYTTPLFAYLVRTGRDDLAREILPLRSQGAEEWEAQGWFDGWDANEVAVALGRPDLIHYWALTWGDGYAYDELVERAEATASVDVTARPTPADTVALAEAYATLQKTPRGQRRHPTKELIKQAAQCRHVSAVLDLLTTLPTDDLNDRASSAFQALWIIGTGADVEPW